MKFDEGQWRLLPGKGGRLSANYRGGRIRSPEVLQLRRRSEQRFKLRSERWLYRFCARRKRSCRAHIIYAHVAQIERRQVGDTAQEALRLLIGSVQRSG